MLCIAHRGARGYAPENTLTAIRLAMAQGADWVEVDVRCVNGQLIVIHDERLDRTTNGRGSVYEQDIERLKGLNAGDGQGVPLLSEVIELVNRQLTINIELKDSASAAKIAPLLASFIARGWQYADFLVSSFYHQDLQTLKQADIDIRIGALLAGAPLELTAFAERLGAWSVNLCLESLTRAMVDDAHRRQLKVLVFTVNHPDDMQRLQQMGVDGIFTDYPDRFITLCAGPPVDQAAIEPVREA